MKPFFFGLRDWWSQWSLDTAGVESGLFRPRELRLMLDKQEIDPHSWLRHRFTRRFALVGEVLYLNDLATDAEFETWFPEPRYKYPRRVVA